MFCTISTAKTKKRLCKNLKIEEDAVGNVPFVRITCYKSVNCKKIEKKLLGKVDTVVLADEIIGASFDKLKVYRNDDFMNSVAEYTFRSILKMCPLTPASLCVCVIDREGKNCEFVHGLARYASQIKVVTENYEKYYQVSDKMYENFGMFPVITDETGEYVMCFDFDSENPRVCFNSSENYCEITKECVKIGAGLSSFVPKGISECDFAGVLNTYNDFKRLRLLSAEIMKHENRYYKVNRENIGNFLNIELK